MTADPSLHIGRSWVGHPLEDECPCPQELCGLVRLDRVVATCEQHPPERAKSLRQVHAADRCPGVCACCGGDPDLVCDACGSHDCWAGQFMCDEAQSAGTTRRDAS